MTQKYLTVIILSLFCAVSISRLEAQDSKTKTKVIVVEKSIDKDGNVEMKKEIKEGKTAEEYIKHIEIEQDIKDKKSIKIKKENRIRIVKKDGDGNEEVMEWSGSGEMPEEFKKWIEDESKSYDLDMMGQKRMMISIDGDDDKKEVIIEMDGDELDEENLLFYGDEMEVKIIKGSEDRKAQLGVVIKEREDNNGVVVQEVIEGTAAQQAGIRSGDIITNINSNAVNSPEELVNIIKDKNAGEEIEIVFLRDGEEYVMKLKLQAFDMYEAVENDDDHEEIIIIKRKK